MSADSFLQVMTGALFVLVFLIVGTEAIARPTRSRLDAALFFGDAAVIIGVSWIFQIFNLKPGPAVNVAIESLLMALPYLLLRLVDDFSGVPRRLTTMAAAGLGISILLLLVWATSKLPAVVVLLLVAYFAAVSGYVAVTVIRSARQSTGVTRHRMRAVGLGTLFLTLVILLDGLDAVLPNPAPWWWRSAIDALSLACGVAFFVGFAAPQWLRRAWQEPDIRHFLGRAVSLPHIPNTEAVLIELERCLGDLFGAYRTVIRFWQPETGTLEPAVESSRPAVIVEPHAFLCFETQRPVFSENLPKEDPEHADLYRIRDVRSVLTAPISVPNHRYGVISIYAVRAPMFAEDDLMLAQLLGRQMGVILETRDLIAQAAKVMAEEESTRLKNDFLSAAAHDLKTPLTALIVQAQLMQHRAAREPGAPADVHGLNRLVRDADRLQRLVTELLDVERAEQGGLLQKLEDTDLGTVARQVCDEFESSLHTYEFDLHPRTIVCCDTVRIRQVVSNLIENAIKYSPDGGTIRIASWLEDGMGHLAIRDEGVGIPDGDLEHVFDRFHRGDNVDDRRFAGMGLGLFICREIARQHGGHIDVSSDGPGHGAEFHLRLPVSPERNPRQHPPQALDPQLTGVER